MMQSRLQICATWMWRYRFSYL